MPFSRWRRAPGARPLVLGHRGARHAAPENTLAAFELAAREGADGVELDVRLDGDGNVIVLHDPTLARVTGKRDSRSAETLAARELAAVDVGAGERVPSLAEVLDWAVERNMRVNVEIKHDLARPDALERGVVALLSRRRDATEHVILSSFHPGIVYRMARALPALPVAWLVHAKQRFARHARGWQLLGAAGVNPERVLVTRPLVDRLKHAGALVNVWTVNDVDEARRLADLGVDALISDNPGKLIAGL